MYMSKGSKINNMKFVNHDIKHINFTNQLTSLQQILLMSLAQ
jgi:hypothetical protein